MQKLTLSIDDDIYAKLHSQIGRGSIGRFVCDAIRPYLSDTANEKKGTAFGMLSHLAKPVDANATAQAKRRYLAQRYAAKQVG
jgi:metal-responsive CopG/Arc/MetJ family transcriptional regulator